MKAHHYILSFDPRDAEVGLTMEEAHAMAVRFAREWFGGHVGVVFTHPEGHNGAGNVHAHIAFCSVRSLDEPVREWMTHESEWRAGGKHHATNKCHEELKRAGYLYFEDKAQREAAAAPETPTPSKTPAKKTTAKKTTKK